MPDAISPYQKARTLLGQSSQVGRCYCPLATMIDFARSARRNLDCQLGLWKWLEDLYFERVGDSWLMSVKSFLKKLDRLEQYANNLSAAAAKSRRTTTKKGSAGDRTIRNSIVEKTVFAKGGTNAP